MHKNRQSGSAHLIIILIVIALLVGALGFVFWQNFMQPKNNTSNTTSTSNKESGLSAEDVVRGVYDLISDQVKSSPTTTVRQELTNNHSPAYKPSGIDYYITASRGYYLIVSDSEVTSNITEFSSPIINSIDNYLVKNNFAKDTNSNSELDDYYYSSNTTCSLSKNESTPVMFCAAIADYSLALSTVAPFVLAYKNGVTNNDVSDTVFGVPDIKSANTGYQTATVSIRSYVNVGGVAGIFYKKDGGQWQYFKSTQQMLACSDYSTVDLRAAFKGEACYNSDYSESSVQ